MGDLTRTTRRGFLGTSGALVIGLCLPGRGDAKATTAMPNTWVRIGSDNRITILCARSEMGQGVYTAMPTLIAEELEVDLARVKVEMAPAGEAFINMALGGQLTGGSTSTRDAYDRLRVAGAQARIVLVQAAAERWGVPPDTCKVKDAVVTGPAGQRATYGQLAEAAAKLTPPKDPVLKPAAAFRYLGKPMKRIDTPSKVNGTAEFGIDVRLPGMGIAVLAQAPALGATVKSWDGSKAQGMPGVRKVVQVSYGIAVVADNYWRARKALEAVSITWDDSAQAGIDSAAIQAELRSLAGKPGATFKQVGDADAALATAAKKLEAEYHLPYVAHATMEPMNFTADVRADRVLLIGPTQFQQLAVGLTAALLKIKPEQIELRTTFLGGGFGRRVDVDYVLQAVEISKAAGMPVKLVWSREDDMTHDYYRPAAVLKMTGGLDAQGRPVALKYSGASTSVTQRLFAAFVKDGVDPFMLEYAPVPYAIPNQWGNTVIAPATVRVGYLRAVSHQMNAFANECFLDELAAAAGQDPVAYRRDLLAGQPRFRRVLDLAAEKAGWGKPPSGRRLGVALMEGYGSFCALVAEVSVADKEIRLHKVTVAVDIGSMINPNIVRQQIESSVIYGMSGSLYDAITLEKGRVMQTNFHDYRSVRMGESPLIDIHLIAEGGAPGGIGEPITAMIAPAVANAVFALNGQRLRALPLKLA